VVDASAARHDEIVMRRPRGEQKQADPRDRWYAVVMAVLITGGITLNAAIHNVEESAPLSTWIGTILLGLAVGVAVVVVGTFLNAWLRRRGYHLDDE
jgi:hypothetical protein